MITELEKNDNRMQEIAYDILNLGEVIATLVETHNPEDKQEEIFGRIDSLSTAVSKCCKELSDKCGEGLEILFQQEVQERKQEEYKLTNAQLEQKVIDLEDYIKIQNGLLEAYKERIKISEGLKAEAIPSSN